MMFVYIFHCFLASDEQITYAQFSNSHIATQFHQYLLSFLQVTFFVPFSIIKMFTKILSSLILNSQSSVFKHDFVTPYFRAHIT